MKTAIVAIVLASASVAAADEWDGPPRDPNAAVYSFDIGSHVRWLGDTSAAILAEDPLGGMRMTVGRSLTNVTAKKQRVDVGLFARWMYVTVDGKLFNELDTSISQHGLAGGVRFDAALIWRFKLVGQAELGMARTALEVREGETMPVEDHHWAPYGTASLGADLLLVDHRRFRLGLGADLGYTFTIPVEMHALPGDRPDEDLSIDTTYSSIGKLDTRGVTYSMSLRGAF